MSINDPIARISEKYTHIDFTYDRARQILRDIVNCDGYADPEEYRAIDNALSRLDINKISFQDLMEIVMADGCIDEDEIRALENALANKSVTNLSPTPYNFSTTVNAVESPSNSFAIRFIERAMGWLSPFNERDNILHMTAVAVAAADGDIDEEEKRILQGYFKDHLNANDKLIADAFNSISYDHDCINNEQDPVKSKVKKNFNPIASIKSFLGRVWRVFFPKKETQLEIPQPNKYETLQKEFESAVNVLKGIETNAPEMEALKNVAHNVTRSLQKATREMTKGDRATQRNSQIIRALLASEGLTTQMGLLAAMWRDEILQPETVTNVTERLSQYDAILTERTLPIIQRQNDALVDAVDIELEVLGAPKAERSFRTAAPIAIEHQEAMTFSDMGLDTAEDTPDYVTIDANLDAA